MLSHDTLTSSFRAKATSSVTLYPPYHSIPPKKMKTKTATIKRYPTTSPNTLTYLKPAVSTRGKPYVYLGSSVDDFYIKPHLEAGDRATYATCIQLDFKRS